MTITLYAQPYDLSATGFYFKDAETFRTKSRNLNNDYGQPVEEFEIQFIDSDDEIDSALAKTFEINQANIAAFLKCAVLNAEQFNGFTELISAKKVDQITTLLITK